MKRLWLAALCVLSMASLAQAQVLGVDGTRFTVDGSARFLTFVSYFDALRATSLETDLDFIRRDLGFDGIRVFPNWWVYESKAARCPTSGDDTLFTPDGQLRGDGAVPSGPLARLLAVVRAARARGLIVDLSFTRETVGQGMSVDAYQRALQRTAFLLRNERHILFDLQNERDLDRPAMHLTPPQVRALRDAVKDPAKGDPRRLVVASTTGSSPPIGRGGAADPRGTVGFVQAAALDAVAFHDPRGAGWPERVTGVLQALLGAGKPVYLQEPTRWRVGETNACGKPESAESDANPAHFRTALQHARQAGAAAWTFHTQQTFSLGPGLLSFRDQILALPPEHPERQLLLGHPGSPRLTFRP